MELENGSELLYSADNPAIQLIKPLILAAIEEIETAEMLGGLRTGLAMHDLKRAIHELDIEALRAFQEDNRLHEDLRHNISRLIIALETGEFT